MGRRGEGWVVLQFILFGFLFVAPVVNRSDVSLAVRVAGFLLGALGLAVVGAAVLGLGPNLTAVPKPKEGGQLVTGGMYGVVRHPIYFGIIVGAFGWALLTGSLPAGAIAFILFLFFDQKSRREERWLAEAYKDYPEYAARVKKLVPWVY